VRYREAAATYRRLFSLHPKSAESRASLVSLGELQLSELGEPKGALESFDAYLRGGGALVQEARYGRIRALAKLGRKGDERRAIEQFLTDYPRSVQASSLRARQIP
jgi:tetratricopeptide (TPR) repeat protein